MSAVYACDRPSPWTVPKKKTNGWIQRFYYSIPPQGSLFCFMTSNLASSGAFQKAVMGPARYRLALRTPSPAERSRRVSHWIITPYDAQRSKLEQALKDEDLNWHNKRFNVDSFQGNEDHVIIISLVRSRTLRFLSSLRRTNVMLTWCQRSMYIVSSKVFLEVKVADSLVGKMAAELGKRPGAWFTHEDLQNGKYE
ncbi:AAA domain-containing protein [Russula compacta]|nr:AAA domain-containing protein [Russula compacta]